MATYLITGATSDVGCRLIESIIAPQDIVIAQGCGDLKHLAPLCQKFPGQIHTYDVDLSDDSAVDIFISHVSERFGAPTHFVHLPALRVVNTKFKNFDMDRFETDLHIQVHSALRLSRAFLPAMAKARFGRVVFMLTSYIIGVPPKNTAAYVTAKHALLGLSKSLCADYAPFGVTVNCVAPYMMETKFLSDTPDLVVQMSAEANPMKRNARVEDVVPAIRFLLSDEAGFISGVTLPVTGGAAIL